MDAEFVVKLYCYLETNHLPVWIDGGWCVDALLCRLTRPHADLDLAVDHQHEVLLRQLLTQWGFKEAESGNSTAWNYVMHDSEGMTLDIHVFEYDAAGNNIYGIAYPLGSLSGTGIIAGQQVRCVCSDWMFRFKTSYSPAEKDRQDVKALADRFMLEVPETHIESSR